MSVDDTRERRAHAAVTSFKARIARHPYAASWIASMAVLEIVVRAVGL